MDAVDNDESTMQRRQFVRRFAELGIDEVSSVGGKNASLGEMYRELTVKGIKVPNGFATTAAAYRHYLEHNHLHGRIASALASLDVTDVDALGVTGARIRSWINGGEMPADLAAEICAAYEELAVEYGTDPDVAVRSSATAEDLPDASFAGQQETYLNIRGAEHLLRACKRVFASLFTDRAISYRVDKGFDHMSVALSLGVQKMVRADKGTSGVIFTLDTESGFRDVVFITAAYGLGENVVQGVVNPDEFYVFKPTLTDAYRPIVKRHLGDKALKMVYREGSADRVTTQNVSVPENERAQFAISDDEVLQLARHACAIERHYSDRAGRPVPMDIEWAKDGVSGELFIVQARPETVHSARPPSVIENYVLEARGTMLAKGKSVGNKIATGRARIILEAQHIGELQAGEVLVTDITDPDWEPVMKIASAIVTNRGGRTCHAAIVARELGISAVVGTGDATRAIQSGQTVTVSCAEGENGYVYEGQLPFHTETYDLGTIGRPKTKLMLNVGNPEQAFAFSALPNDGVGLARLEFIINTNIRVHPRALLEYESLDSRLREDIDRTIAGYPGPREFYIGRLAEGVATIAAAFYPKPVIVRLSDFKSNEYAALIGGEAFEPKEENPMLGFRGASRYPSEDFAACFALECAAINKVRDEMDLTNVAVMIPFVRTVDEAADVLELLKKEGLARGEKGLKVYLMCEIPANALLAEKFLKYCDGFSIGSNDLTQLTLGVDRDSERLSGYDERNEAVLQLMDLAIRSCKKHHKYIGICGQAPSDFPEITRWLVDAGIDSISLNPDSILRMTQVVLEAEKDMRAYG